MIPQEHYQRRRSQLLDRLPGPALLVAGGTVPRNAPDALYPYRADSNFLLFFGDVEPGSAALFDPDEGSVTLFLPERTTDSALWLGSVPPLEQVREDVGVDRVLPVETLRETVAKLTRGREVASCAVADPVATELVRAVTGAALDFRDPARLGAPALLDALIDLRLHKEEPEIEEIRRASVVTAKAAREAMAGTRPGVAEQELAGRVEGCFHRHGCVPAFEPILTVRGEVLHNQAHAGTLAAGDLVLIDLGAERPSGYAADVSRTWPVTGRFEGVQRDLYELVLAANATAAGGVAPGVRYGDLHLAGARVIAEGLVDLGVLRGDPDELVASGAHALFFPHGIGHLLGLDGHDLISFGDRITHPGHGRSAQFGTKFLRLDRDLAPGMVVTIEPGVYFVPAILHHPEFRETFAAQVDFPRAEEFLSTNDGRGFGGIRIEDDILTTHDGNECLTPGIPREMTAVEILVGTDPAG